MAGMSGVENPKVYASKKINPKENLEPQHLSNSEPLKTKKAPTFRLMLFVLI